MSSITIIKPKTNPFDISWKEIWESKDLFYFLTWRDIKIRYKQTLLGILWIIIQPLISIVVFTIVFGNFVKIPSDGIPYPLFVFIGLYFWNFFATAFSASSNSLISNENILKKVYFAKIMAPISSTFSSLVDLLPVTAILIVMFFYYKVVPSLLALILFPLMILMILIFSLGIGMILAPLNARFRDIRYVIPFMIQVGLFATPVIYPTSLFGGQSVIIRIFNPVAEAIEVIRSGLFGTRPMNWEVLIMSALFTVSVFFVGFYIFRKQEDKFIDIL